MQTASASPASADFLDRLAAWDGHAVVLRHDPPTGATIIIAIHRQRGRQAVGGTRMKAYGSLAEALVDAQRLAAGMTDKWAALGQPYGGAKAVLALPGPLDAAARDGLLGRYGDLIASLRGAFGTGPDMGTTPADMALLGEHTEHVHGLHPDGSGFVDPGPYTARGVEVSIHAALKAVFGDPSPRGRRILVQGVGDVGEPLARALAQGGAELLLSDLDTAKCEALAGELGARTVASAAVYDTSCDVYAPCAVGATLSADTVGRLPCRIVAGSANNQLAEATDALRLHHRGILYVPDYVANGGGALAFALLREGERDLDRLMTEMDTIGRSVAAILAEARRDDSPTLDAARRRVDAALAVDC